MGVKKRNASVTFYLVLTINVICDLFTLWNLNIAFEMFNLKRIIFKLIEQTICICLHRIKHGYNSIICKIVAEALLFNFSSCKFDIYLLAIIITIVLTKISNIIFLYLKQKLFILQSKLSSQNKYVFFYSYY